VVGTSLTIALAMILFGVALIYSGWTNRPLTSIVTGDNTTKRS
jgi:hypothetical protein